MKDELSRIEMKQSNDQDHGFSQTTKFEAPTDNKIWSPDTEFALSHGIFTFPCNYC